MAEEDDLVKKIISENRDGLERLAREEPAEEARSRFKRLKRKIQSLFRRDDRTGRISA
jgi:polyhydroxyalkanoate synthesis regulator phasin